MKKSVTILMYMLLILLVSSCSSRQPSEKSSWDEGNSDSNNESNLSESSILYNDFPDTVLDDVQVKFESSGIRLSNLQRDTKGERIKAEIETDDLEKSVPRAIELLAENFSSVEKITVMTNGGGVYAINMDEYLTIADGNSEDVDKNLWNAVTDFKEKTDILDDK